MMEHPSYTPPPQVSKIDTYIPSSPKHLSSRDGRAGNHAKKKRGTVAGRESGRVEAGTEEQADVSCNRPEASHPLSLSPSSDVMPTLSSLLFPFLSHMQAAPPGQGCGEIQERRERVLQDRE
jgi:hypothetical protein